jgi:hypothetical protein
MTAKKKLPKKELKEVTSIPKPKKIAATPHRIKVSLGDGYCRKCKTVWSLTKFYEATNPMIDANGFMSVCKDCCNRIYEQYFIIYNNMEKALQLTCQDLDVRFSHDALKQTQSHAEGCLVKGKPSDKIFGLYKSKIGSTTKHNDSIDGFRYRDSEIVMEDKAERLSSESPISDALLEYWGRNHEPYEYEFLDAEMTKIQSSFECPDYGMEMLMRDISFINLDIEKTRLGVSKYDISKLIETRSKLMNDAKMKPIQATGAEANAQVSFGTMIKRWETTKPVPTTLDDEMKKYIDTYMVGQLAKIEGMDNDITQKYDNELKPYTIDFDEIYNADDKQDLGDD